MVSRVHPGSKEGCARLAGLTSDRASATDADREAAASTMLRAGQMVAPRPSCPI